MTLPAHTRESNRFLAKHYDRLDRYNEYLDLADEARARINALKPVDTTVSQGHPLQTGAITEAWIDATLDHANEIARRELLFRTLTELHRDASASANSIRLTNADTILAGLNSDLQSLLSEVAGIATELDGASTAQDAIAANRGDTWQRLTAHTADYHQLRLAQTAVMRDYPDYQQSAQPSAGGEEPASDLHLANLDALWPDWRTPGSLNHTVTVNGSPHRAEPWPADPVEFLLWLATSTAQAWIPTRAQLDQLNEERINAANPNPTVLAGITTTSNTAQPIRELRHLRQPTPVAERRIIKLGSH
ncbi:hypothetical protein ACWDUN_03995 [Mycobacterium sp. NPDC003323]